MTAPTPNEAFVDVYAAANQLEADRLLSLLADESIEGHLSENKVNQFPTDSHHTYVIAVDTDHQESATALIQRAREDGVITKDGNFPRG